MSSYETMYALARGPQDESAISHIVCEIAREALADDEWRDMYDKVVADGIGFPEDHPRMIAQSCELLAEPDPWTPAFGGWWMDPASAAIPVQERARILGVPTREPVSNAELAAAAIAAQWWCICVGTPDLDRAASIGVGAVRSMAAILARGTGHGMVVRPITDTTTHEVWRLERMEPYVRHARAWAFQNLSAPEAHWALLAACSDLSWGNPGSTLTLNGARVARATLGNLETYEPGSDRPSGT